MATYDYGNPPAEIRGHPFHTAGHVLKLVPPAGPTSFVCGGCKELGNGKEHRYKCNICDSFELHMDCGFAKPTLKHPLFGNKEFRLLREPTPPVEKTRCDACAGKALGFVYHCPGKDLDLHPCCAALKMDDSFRLDEDGGEIIIKLCKKAKRACVVCGERGNKAYGKNQKLWAYRWDYGKNKEYMHVQCMKKIAHEGERQQRHHQGIVLASVPIMKRRLESSLAARPSEGSSSVAASSTGGSRSKWMDRLINIAAVIGGLVIAIITGNPVALIETICGPVLQALRDEMRP